MADYVIPRLEMVPASKLAKYRKEVGPLDKAPWPEIEGCVTALCTARSGSTLLSRQLETLYEIGEMGETLNWAKLQHSSARHVVAARKEPWFSFKITSTNLLALELTGFVDAYIDKTVFIHLIRRDIIAQAVSRAKASQTGQWHPKAKPAGALVYDAGLIADSVRSIALHVEQMRRYVERTGRPHTKLLYEDIAANGLSAAKTAGDFLGLPPRKLENGGELLRPIEVMGDEINGAWIDRFRKEMDASIGGIVESYVASVDLGTPQPWATSEAGPNHEILRKVAKHERKLDAVLVKFSDETVVLVRAAVETLRVSFPTGSCFVVDNDDDTLTIRFGAESGVSSAIFTIIAYPGKLKIFVSATDPLNDVGKVLKGKDGRRYFTVKEASRLTSAGVSALFEQAVRQAQPPLPDSGRGRLIIKSRTRDQATGDGTN